MNKTFDVSLNELKERFDCEKKPINFSQHDAFACLYDAYVDRIYHYIYLRVADAELAEEITAQVFLEAWEKLPAYQPGKSPIISWLYGIAYNAVMNQSHVYETLLDFDAVNTPEQCDERDEPSRKLQPPHQVLQELAEKEQQVLILKFICGFSTAKMDRQLDKHQGIVRSLEMDELNQSAKYTALKIEEIYPQ